MSLLTTTPLLSAPAAATAPTLAGANSAWANSAWVELIASTSGTTALAGLSLRLTVGTYSGIEAEFDFGVGAASSEVVVSTLRLALPNSGANSWNPILLPVPVGGISAGSRIAVRVRESTAGARTWSIGLLYYTGLSTDQQLTTSHPLACVPSAANGVTLTPSGTAWNNSSWVQLTAGLSNPVALAGITLQTTWSGSVDYELDLGTGSGGAEVVITTLRTTLTDQGQHFFCHWLPGLYPVAASTRIAARLRKSGTSTTTTPVALLYYDDVSGTVPITGTGDETFAALALAATGTAVPPDITGTGAEAITGPALAGTGTVATPAYTGTASVTIGGPALSGFGTVTTRIVTRRLRQCALPTAPDNTWTFLRELEVLTQAGVGRTTDPGADPQLMVRISRNGGRTWGPERWLSAGPLGQYRRRQRARNLGRYRQGALQVVMTAPVPWALLRASAQVDAGTPR